MDKIIIAIDGYSSCGKSTLAKGMASRLKYIYIDSGAMYRAVTLFFLRHNVSLDDAEQTRQAVENITISFNADIRTILNGEDVEKEIRRMEVSNHVSQVSALPAVRRALVRQQQAMGQQKGIVMDGRDIGTVVFPNAELKIFLTADPEKRVQRRFEELKSKGIKSSVEDVRQNLSQRDRIDSSREDSPLRQATDAIVIDNTQMTRDEQLAYALELAYSAGAVVE